LTEFLRFELHHIPTNDKLLMLIVVFVSQPSVGLTAPLPRYHSAAAAAADAGFTGQLSPVMSPQAVPFNTPAASPVCHSLGLRLSLTYCRIIVIKLV